MGFRIVVDANEAAREKGRIIAELNGLMREFYGEAPKKRFAKAMLGLFATCVAATPLGPPPGVVKQPPGHPGLLRASGTLTLDDAVAARGHASGTADVAWDGEGASQAVISFDTPYAMTQHEQLYYSHPNGGRAKYVEGPIVENAEMITLALKGESQ